MPNQKKKKVFQNIPVPVFTSACTYIPENIFEDSNSATISAPKSDLEQKLDFYQKKAAVPNTVKATQNWVKKLDEFRLRYNYVAPIETIEDPSLIKQQTIDKINRYISKNGAIHGLNLHDKYQFPDLYDILNGKMKDLQEKGLGKKDGSVVLTVQQVREILNNEFLDPKMPQSLLYRVFFRIATIFACQGGKHYLLQINQFQIQSDGDASNNFYLQPNQNWCETGIWYLKTHCGLNRVGNFMKDIRQKNANVPEDAIMNVTGHKSSQGVRAYKTVSESQKINMIKTLINTIEPASNINPINQESSAVLTKITGSHINFNTNSIAMQDINMVQGV
ncbi:824_t:CDS:2 [Gigaspora margarita]|uniref:824_t:CDS:1 n=1 Tax=Gigaspora margarita TaxID=4874 RepID=A0ABM8W5C1_GIGMA|nr:824_t:CDS:2 [Gigaspora margarita]